MSAKSFVKRSVAGHSWLGLLTGAFMYLICMSGTLAVFHQEFERWEQPNVEEYRDYDVQLLESAYLDFIDSHPEETGHLHLVFPKSGIPRVVVENDHVARFVNQDGTLGEFENLAWTKMLVKLHAYLSLPNTLGLIVVSIFGVLLLSLILSGFLAHPRVLKDAFRFRRGGSKQLERVDIHNRLSVWGAPFHIMIALTGAYFGLASVVVIVIASVFHGGDQDIVVGKVFGQEPELSQDLRPANIIGAMENFSLIAPKASPLFLTIHEPDTSGQFIEIYAQHPGRLIYSENYRFDIQGNYLGKAGFSDGEFGRQFLYSTYRLHFGEFGGFSVKILYFVLGLSLTIISVTGINLWLEKRRHRDLINDVWLGFVWASPAALCLAAIAQIIFGLSATVTFWVTYSLFCCYSGWRREESESRRNFQFLSAASLLALVLLYSANFYEHALTQAALGVNSALIVAALVFLLLGRKSATLHIEGISTKEQWV